MCIFKILFLALRFHKSQYISVKTACRCYHPIHTHMQTCNSYVRIYNSASTEVGRTYSQSIFHQRFSSTSARILFKDEQGIQPLVNKHDYIKWERLFPSPFQLWLYFFPLGSKLAKQSKMLNYGKLRYSFLKLCAFFQMKSFFGGGLDFFIFQFLTIYCFIYLNFFPYIYILATQ